MLRKPVSLLSANLVDEVYASAKAFYSADDAQRALGAAQVQFQAAVATGAFPAEKVRAMLHELDDMRDMHLAETQRAFRAFQTVAFMALEKAMVPGFQDELIELTARTSHEDFRNYPAFRYARLDLHREREGPSSRGDLTMYVGEDLGVYAGPDRSAGRQPSQCRSHHFVAAYVLPQSWDWRHAGV